MSLSELYTTRDIFFGKYFDATLGFAMPVDLKVPENDMLIELCEAVIRRNPEDVASLKLAGHLYTEKGDYARGLDADLKLSRLLPEDALVWYNLACSHSLLADADQALEALNRAIDLGYNDAEHMQVDPDLDNIRKEAGYAELLKKLTAPKPA